MEKLVFADTIKNTVKTVLKVPIVVIDDPIFRLHYKATAFTLLCLSILVSGYQFFGEPIMCIQKDDIPEKLLNTYCWIEGTFTLPDSISKKVGTEVVYPGIEKYLQGDRVIEHAYYQWVCFVLFLQVIIFCIPYMLWKIFEGGCMKVLVDKLHNPLLKEKERNTRYQELAMFFIDKRYQHKRYARKYILCEVLNFIGVVGQIYFINKFLGGQFLTYGPDVVKYINSDHENAVDPMIKVFPRMSKCTFHRYGSSGDVQKHDALCLLPLNIINEKVYVIMWFWLVILAVLGGMKILYRIITILSAEFRYHLLKSVSSLTSKDDIKDMIDELSYGDWFLLYMLAENMDNLHFRELVLELKEPGAHAEKVAEENSPPITDDTLKAAKAKLKDAQTAEEAEALLV